MRFRNSRIEGRRYAYGLKSDINQMPTEFQIEIIK